jgi:hypothetical protein
MSFTNNQKAAVCRLSSWERCRPGGEWMGKGFAANTPARRQRSQVGAADPISGGFSTSFLADIKRVFVFQRHDPVHFTPAA